MRKKQFGKLLTISLSDECYGLVEKIANVYQMSMGAVIRDSIMYSIDQNETWMVARPRPFDAVKTRGELIEFRDWADPEKDVKDIEVTGSEEEEK